PFALEQREHDDTQVTDWRESLFGLFKVGPFPLTPFPCPFPALWPLWKPLGIWPLLRGRHDQCGMGQSRQAGNAAEALSGLAQAGVECIGLGCEVFRATLAESFQVAEFPAQRRQLRGVLAL